MNPPTIRSSCEADRKSIHAIHVAAFESGLEAGLVDLLFEQARPIVSLVAEGDNGRIIGHILFTPVTLAEHDEVMIMGLAPMAVAPEHQRQGIGSQLVRAGLEACQVLGSVAVVVLGHPDYYPRFGFVPSTRFGIDSEYAVPEEVFMAIELVRGALEGRTGPVKYHSAFDDV